MIYGTPGVRIDNDVTDIIGIRTLVLSQMWSPSRWPMEFAELDNERPAAPGTGQGMLLVGEQTRRNRGAMRTTWTYEGVHGDGKGVTFKDRDNSWDYGFEPGFAEVDLRLHPDVQSLMDTYGGVADPDYGILWDPTIAGDGAPRTGLDTAGSSEDRPNPMYGRESFLRLEGTYHHRYASFAPPTKAGVGQIHKSGGLPGRAPTYTDRDWLMLPPAYLRRGTVYDITEVYWLSGPGGWPVPLYGKGAAAK